MKIVACIKRTAVVDEDVDFDENEGDVDQDYLEWDINEWDTYAIEEALRLRESAGAGAGEVVVLSAGGQDVEDVLVRGLAMGADRAVRAQSDVGGASDPLRVAAALAVVSQAEQPDLILCGALSGGSGNGAIPAALAGLLDLPCVAVVTQITVGPSPGALTVHREIDGGVIDVVEVSGPAVLSLQTGINEPRYVTLRAIQAAQQIGVAVVEPALFTPESDTPGRRMFLPEPGNAQMLDGDETAVARRIVDIIKEALT